MCRLENTYEHQPKIKYAKNIISYYEQLVVHKFDNLDETLERRKLLKFTQRETINCIGISIN